MKKIVSNKEIRFGLMCKSPILKAWEAECINKALAVEDVSLGLLIYPAQKLSLKKNSFIEKFTKQGSSKKLLSFLLNRILLRAKCNSPIDLSKKFGNISSITCTTINRNSSEYFSSEDIKKIKSANLDFILLFSGFDNIKGETLKITRYGIWSFHHSDIEKYPGNPPCFWEIYNKESITGAVLRKLSSENDKALILKRGYFRTITNSFKENLNNVHFESAEFLKEICDALLNCIDSKTYESKLKSSVQKYFQPNNIQIIKFFLILIKNKITKTFKNIFFIEQWNIGYIESPIEALLETDKELKINWIMSPKRNEFFADPSVIKFKKAYYIFFENFSYKKNKANIASLLLNFKHTNSDITISLDRPHHLSYPFVFQYNDDIYMIPGEWEINSIALYKAQIFPSVWEKITKLIKDIPIIDPTLFKYNGLWWLFFTQKKQGPDIRLYIFYSDSLFGPWQPHKKNPVKTDISSARPAGNVFRWKENIIRPAQDSSKTYGARIVFNKILKLTPEEFEEEPIKYIEHRRKESYNKGMHTINSIDNLTVIDGKRYIFSLNNVKKILIKKFYEKHPIKRTGFKYTYLNIPKYVERREYTKSINKTVESLKKQTGILSIYQVGSINNPGISDIDIITVYKDECQDNHNPRTNLREIDKYLFTHNIGGTCETHFKLTNKFILFHNMDLLWGEEIRIREEKLTRQEINAINIQTALEYLVSYFIDITVQLKYRVIKLRTLFQHIKAIKYDLDYLDISSGPIFEMIHELKDRMDSWFDKPQDINEINEWIDKFYPEFIKFVEMSLYNHSFYIPKWANLKLGHNLRLQFGKSVDCQFTGLLLPKSISGINKRIFNINNRLNSFKFSIPFSTVPTHKILEERCIMAKEMKECNLKNLPHYTPLVSGFLLKVL